MKIKTGDTHEAARLILAMAKPLEIEIPDEANITNFISSVRYYIRRTKMIVSISDASTKDTKIIYVTE
jgi:hypothetical protein